MKTALAITAKTYASQHMQENENLWKKHVSDFIRSGLTKKAFCKKHEVNYGRFFYWIRKLSLLPLPTPAHKKKKEDKAQFMPVKLKSQLPEQIKATLLCTLSLKNGCALQIHDEQSLSLILRKMGLI